MAKMGPPYRIDKDELKQKMLEYLDSDGYKTITKFCVAYKISRSYLYKLFEDNEDLKDIGEQINLVRECALEEGGLSGDLNAGMAKFALNQLGWREKQEIKQESFNVTISKEDADRLI